MRKIAIAAIVGIATLGVAHAQQSSSNCDYCGISVMGTDRYQQEQQTIQQYDHNALTGDGSSFTDPPSAVRDRDAGGVIGYERHY